MQYGNNSDNEDITFHVNQRNMMGWNRLQTFIFALTVQHQIRPLQITFLYTHSVSEEMHCEKELGEDLHEASDPYTHWICGKTVKYFGIGVDDYYSFKPQQILEAHLEVHPFQNGKE